LEMKFSFRSRQDRQN